MHSFGVSGALSTLVACTAIDEIRTIGSSITGPVAQYYAVKITSDASAAISKHGGAITGKLEND